MFETILSSELDESLLAAVRQHKGKVWSSNFDVTKYRSELLKLQSYRCAYCQILIDADEVGFREIDHIFPKAGTLHCAEYRGRSNAFEDRIHTFGYPQYTYEPLNLIVVCKFCNSYKKSFDPLVDRSILLTEEYPSHESILWFYPYSHRYSQHIERTGNWTYKQLSPQGEAVIRICRLDQASALESRFTARAYIKVRQAGSFRAAIMGLAVQIMNEAFSEDHATQALSQALGFGVEVCQTLLSFCLSYLKEGVITYLERIEELLVVALGDATIDFDRASASIKEYSKNSEKK